MPKYFVFNSPTSLYHNEIGQFIYINFPQINKPPHQDWIKKEIKAMSDRGSKGRREMENYRNKIRAEHEGARGDEVQVGDGTAAWME
jgi:hypothetical protein